MRRALLRVAIASGLFVVTCIVVAYASRLFFSRPGWSETRQRVFELRYALEDYRADHGRYPSTNEGLRVLLEPPPKKREGPRIFDAAYVRDEKALVDTWGRRVLYRVKQPPEEGCVVYSLGRDGKVGGAGPDEDIVEVCTPDLWSENQ